MSRSSRSDTSPRAEPIRRPSHLIAGVGASAVIDQLTMMTCDPGDGVMTVRPVYNGFFNVSSSDCRF